MLIYVDISISLYVNILSISRGGRYIDIDISSISIRWAIFRYQYIVDITKNIEISSIDMDRLIYRPPLPWSEQYYSAIVLKFTTLLVVKTEVRIKTLSDFSFPKLNYIQTVPRESLKLHRLWFWNTKVWQTVEKPYGFLEFFPLFDPNPEYPSRKIFLKVQY